MKHLNKLTTLLIALTLSTSLMAQNNYLDFDGENDYVDCGIDQSSLSDNFTIEAWVYPESAGNHKGVGGAHGGNSEGIIFLQYENDGWYCGIGNGTGYLGATISLVLNEWSHVSMTLTNKRDIDVYLNGILTAEISSDYDFDPYGSNFWIGRAYDTSNRYLDGNIDEFRIWDDIRTEDEIRQNMYRELPDPSGEANLSAYYKLNSTSGTIATDSKGSYNGTLTNMTGNVWQTSPAMFGPNNCLDFDGSDDYVSINNLYVSGSAFTVETWVYFRSFNGSADANITNLFRGGDENVVLRIGDEGMDNNMPQFVVKVGGTQYKLNANARLNTNTWYHLAGVYDGSEMNLYINGELDKSQSQSGTLTTTTETFILGGSSGTPPGTRLLDGLMEEVRVWSDARTASEIRDNMCKNLTGNETDLMAYYSCDNSSGTTLQDFTGNEYDGTLTNMANSDWVSSSAFNIWLNTSSNSWNSDQNWSRGSKPPTTEPFDNLGIYSYSGGTNCNIDYVEPAANHLVLGSNSSLTLAYGPTITGNLILESNLDLNGKQIYLMSNATLIEDNGRIYGSSGSISTQRDLSNIDENVAGLGAEITTSANMGSTTITRTHAAASSPVSIKRRYTITPTNNESLNATLVFHYYPGELNGLDESTLDLLRYNGSTWVEQVGCVNDNNANTITLSSIDAFSDWTAGGDAAPILETSNPSQNYFSGTTSVIIASAATVTYSQNITAATVSITPVASGDLLSVSNLPGGLTSSWDNTTKILTISGTSTASNYQTALRNVKFETTSTTSGTRTIDFNLGDGIGLTLNGQKHFYELIGDGVSSITWTNARTAALGSTYAGASGYLATIMSEEENTYLKDKVTQDTWIGGSDAAAEGVWKWMDGPEAGTQFWSGGIGGHTVNGNYCHWYTNEPNNADNEDYLHMRGSDLPAQWGYWNDYVNNNSGAKYYITEYGGDGTVFTTMDDATIVVQTDLTWDGSVGSDWNTAGNWNYDVVPTAYCNITIPDVVTSDPIIGVDVDVSCIDLTIESGGSLTIQSTSEGTGSLIVSGISTGNVICKRYVDEITKAATWHYVSSPVSGQALDGTWMSGNSIVNTPPYQFFRWDEDTDYWIIYGSTGNPEAFGDETFIDGRGYCLTRSGAGELSFTGTVRTSNVTYAATYTTGKGEGYNLVGNPYTSSLGVTNSATTTGKFLATNTALLDDSYEALYIWDEQTGYTGSRNDYKVISNGAISGYTQIDQHYIQPGQAFMVKVVSGGGDLAFNENMQAHSSDSYYKDTKESWPSVELTIENNELFNSTAIGFNENMTTGLDPSYDVAKLKGNPDIALYTKLVEDNGIDFTIQALPLISNQEVEVKIGLDVSQAGNYNFKLTDSENFDETISIKLEDKKTGELIDFREIEEYSFNISQAGEIRERFVLHFNNATGIEDQIPETENIRFYVYDNKLYIIDEELKNGTIQLYNLIGQPVMEKRYSGQVITIDLDLSTGYYIVKIITDKASINGKIYIE